MDRRRHKRFSATAFLNTPVYLTPLPPYFAHPTRGRLIDLSAGGVSILINEIIPMGTYLNLKITFPDKSAIESAVEIRYLLPRGKGYLLGIQFLAASAAMIEHVDRMSEDYINCELRIQNNAPEICRTDCAFFTMCSKKEKMEPAFNLEDALTMAFDTLDKERQRQISSQQHRP